MSHKIWVRGLALAALVLAGCHSRAIDATVRNMGTTAASPVEVDYPSASFGRETLAPGAEFQYRFKVIGEGATKVVWTDAAKVEHTVAGPKLSESDEGALLVTIDGNSASLSYVAKAAH